MASNFSLCTNILVNEGRTHTRTQRSEGIQKLHSMHHSKLMDEDGSPAADHIVNTVPMNIHTRTPTILAYVASECVRIRKYVAAALFTQCPSTNRTVCSMNAILMHTLCVRAANELWSEIN